MPGHYTSVHRFINQTADFVLGFEAGRFYEACREEAEDGHLLIEGMFHARNEGELLSIAKHHGFSRRKWDRLDENWAEGVFVR